MSPTVHRIYIGTFFLIFIAVLVFLVITGWEYYLTPVEERFFHDAHNNLKPSGLYGHGYGVVGSLMMLVGVSGYMLRKRLPSLQRLGILKHWLEFHIFLCTTGPLLVLFHTAFKFGGLVAVSFWSMVAVVLSGIIGRFLYVRIPRTIQGKELSIEELQKERLKISERLQQSTAAPDLSTDSSPGIISPGISGMMKEWRLSRKRIRVFVSELNKADYTSSDRKTLLSLFRRQEELRRRIVSLKVMQKFFKYWHVAHLPFALLMLIVMIIHIGVAVAFGYVWILK